MIGQEDNMKKAMAFLLGITIIIFSGGLVKATEYDPAYTWYYTSGFARPEASSVACSPSLAHCFSLVYDSTAGKIRGFLVTNPKIMWSTFMPFANFEYAVTYSAYWSNNYPFMNYPFGVQYNRNDGNYYIWIWDTYMRFWEFDTISGVAAPLTNKCNVSGLCCASLGQGTPNTGNVYYVYPTGVSAPYNSLSRYNMFTGTTETLGNLYTPPYTLTTSCTIIDYSKSYVGEKSSAGSNFQIRAYLGWHEGATYRQSTENKNMTGFPVNVTGIHYELNNNIFYVINGTANVTWGIYRVTSPDFVSYGSPQIYYPFNTGTEEYITHSIGAKADTGTFFQMTRESNTTYGGYANPQIDNNNITFNTFNFRSSVFNPVTGFITGSTAGVTATCNALNYTTSGIIPTAGILTLGLPCTTNISVDYINPLLKPETYTETYDLPSGCGSLYTNILYSQPYTLSVKVTDGLTGSPLQSATVTLDSKTNITDSLGNAYIYDVFPYDSPTFISQFTNATCSHGLTTFGTSHPFFYSVSKNQYNTVTTTPLTLVNATSNFAIGTVRTVLFPNGINVQITAHTSDGFAVSPISTTANWSGLFVQSNIIQGATYNMNQTSAGGLPINIILFSNITSYNLTVNLLFNNVTDTMEVPITNGTNDNCVNGYCTIDFTLPYTFTSFPCFINNDCVGGTCLGNIFYDLNGCKAGVCSYNQQFCTSCDSRVGCYNIGTTEPCSGDVDCNKTCTSPSTARYGYCASTGNCVYKNVPCDSNVVCINTTIPVIAANGSTIGSYSAGICANHQVCFSQSTTQQLFQIIKQWVSIGFILNPLSVTTNTTLYLDQRVSCTPTEASSTARYCITGVNIPKIESGSIPESNQIVTQVGGTLNTWQYQVNPYDSNYYRFFDISYQCDLNCDTDIQFCQYGCNQETGFCYQQPIGGGEGGLLAGCNQSIFMPICSVANTIVNTTTNITLSQSMQAGGYGFILVFLTPIFWIMIIIIAVMMVASYYTKHMEIGGVSGLLLLVAFAIYFPELVWITIIIIIISAYLIGRQIVRVVQGG